MQITIYSTPTCPHCMLAKQYLKEKKIAFTDIDVARDSEKAEEMIKISGQMGVPVIKIDEKMSEGIIKTKIIVGFNEHELDKALNK